MPENSTCLSRTKNLSEGKSLQVWRTSFYNERRLIHVRHMRRMKIVPPVPAHTSTKRCSFYFEQPNFHYCLGGFPWNCCGFLSSGARFTAAVGIVCGQPFTTTRHQHVEEAGLISETQYYTAHMVSKVVGCFTEFFVSWTGADAFDQTSFCSEKGYKVLE